MNSERSQPDPTKIKETIDLLKDPETKLGDNPEIVKATLENGLRIRVNARSFEFISDEPEKICGANSGPRPTEYVLGALGSCMAILYSMYAVIDNIKIDKLIITLRGYDGDSRIMFDMKEGNPGFEKIDYNVEIESNDDYNKIKKLRETVERSSPIRDTISRPIPLTGNLTVNGVQVK